MSLLSARTFPAFRLSFMWYWKNGYSFTVPVIFEIYAHGQISAVRESHRFRLTGWVFIVLTTSRVMRCRLLLPHLRLVYIRTDRRSICFGERFVKSDCPLWSALLNLFSLKNHSVKRECVNMFRYSQIFNPDFLKFRFFFFFLWFSNRSVHRWQMRHDW